MEEINIHLPHDIEAEIDELVSLGTFSTKEEAVIALIRAGLNSLKKRHEPVVAPAPKYQPVPPHRPPEKWPDHYEFK
jgi:hypothetical protein